MKTKSFKKMLMAVITASAMFLFNAVHMASAESTNNDLETLVRPYKVLHTNQPDHEGAEFAVFRSRREPSQRWGLYFQELKAGAHYGDAFVCDNADVIDDDTLQCSKLVADKGVSKKEVVTIGLAGSGTCEVLAGKVDSPRKRIILLPRNVSDPEGRPVCPGAHKVCACYEIAHYCFNGTGYDTLCATATGDEAAPPGSGAGSGGSH